MYDAADGRELESRLRFCMELESGRSVAGCKKKGYLKGGVVQVVSG